MKIKNRKNNLNLKDIIEKEIKENSIRQYFPNSFKPILEKVVKKKISDHKDFTDIPFVTIDGIDSKDFDDAVWAEDNKDSSRIMIAIADVSYFIEKNDPLDVEAKKRGNSFYFPDRVIPMFPEEISNNICSLVPNQERASIIVEIEIKHFKVTKFDIHRARIISSARLTYEEVDNIYKNNLRQDKNFKLITNLFRAYEKLKIMSKNRSKINFSSDEFQIIINAGNDFILKKKKKIRVL